MIFIIICHDMIVIKLPISGIVLDVSDTVFHRLGIVLCGPSIVFHWPGIVSWDL